MAVTNVRRPGLTGRPAATEVGPSGPIVAAEVGIRLPETAPTAYGRVMRSCPTPVRALLVTGVLAVVASFTGCSDDADPPAPHDAAETVAATQTLPPGRKLTADLTRPDGGVITFSAVLGEPTRDDRQLPAGFPDPAACAFDTVRDLLVPVTLHGVSDVDLVSYLLTVQGPAPVAVAVSYGGGSPTCVAGPTTGDPVRFGAQWSNAAQPRMAYVNRAVVVVRGTAPADQAATLRKTLLTVVETPAEEGRPTYLPRDCVPAPCAAGLSLGD